MECMRCKNAEGTLVDIHTAVRVVQIPLCPDCLIEHDTVSSLQSLSNPPSPTMSSDSGSLKRSSPEESDRGVKDSDAKRQKSEAALPPRKANFQRTLADLDYWGGPKPTTYRRVVRVPKRLGFDDNTPRVQIDLNQSDLDEPDEPEPTASPTRPEEQVPSPQATAVAPGIACFLTYQCL